MSSAARAERRRQARAAAKLPAEVEGLRLVYQRDDGDCLRGAIATVLGTRYEDTAAADGYAPDEARELWRAWADARGLIMRQYLTHAPAFLDEPWIAVVRGHAAPHAVVMRRGRMIFNPSPGSPQQAFGRRDVLASMLVGDPAWVTATSERMLALIRQGSPLVWTLDNQHAVAWHRAHGRELDARAMERRLSTKGLAA